ncbi:MAG: HDOD domain-containing protein [Planctomycetales bacterium]|nr:HDOD domain-containing protein [Planctomycetales bacterium]
MSATQALESQKIDINTLIANAQLPALPQTAITLLELSQDPNNGPAEFARPIEADAGLMGQILRFVNSSYFGFSREISSIRQALALVGVRTIKNFALWSAVFSLVPDPKFGTFNLKKLWQDSLRRAIFARVLGKSIKLPNAEDLFAAALLQDMAIPLLLVELPEQYEKLISQQCDKSKQIRLSTLERELFGWDHAEVAGALARNWRLPEEFATLIERHPKFHLLMEATPPQRDAACVAIASLLPSCQDQVWDERDEFHACLETLSKDAVANIQSLMRESDVSFEEFAPVMRVGVPSVSLVQWLNS